MRVSRWSACVASRKSRPLPSHGRCGVSLWHRPSLMRSPGTPWSLSFWAGRALSSGGSRPRPLTRWSRPVPSRGLLDRVRAAGCELSLTADQLEAVGFLDADLESVVADTNEQIMVSELSSRRSFFDTIEKAPLTDEQARAVVCFDNRVQVLAAAGSGKTSVMVARAAYAVSRGFVAPGRICCWRSTRLLRSSCRNASRRGCGRRDRLVRAAGLHVPLRRTRRHRPGHRQEARLARWLAPRG